MWQQIHTDVLSFASTPALDVAGMSWRSAQGFDLIPVSVSGEGVQDGGGVEQNKVGIARRDMMCGWRMFCWDARKTRRS